MAGKLKYFQTRNGSYYARMSVPELLRPFIGKRELSEALGPDRRAAERAHAGVIAGFHSQISEASRQHAEAQGAPVPLARFPLTNSQIARKHYEMRLKQDADGRNHGPEYSNVGIDDGYVALLRQGIAGSLPDCQLADLVIHQASFFQRAGNTDARFGSPEWRELARALCQAEYEALERVVERDTGNFTGTPANPLIANAEPTARAVPILSITKLFEDYVASLKVIGKGREIERRWRPVIKDLRKFLKHDDVNKITKKNLLDWRNVKIQTLSAKTVSDVYLAAVRAMLNWAHANDLIKENPSEKVAQEVPKKIRTREKGFTTAEAVFILKATILHSPTDTGNPKTTESPHTTATINWVPLICAFTGARPSEITQARAEDFRVEDDFNVLRITPEAGTVKTGMYRDVPLHPQLVELGLMKFIAGKSGPLFHANHPGKDASRAAKVMSGRLAGWLQSKNLIPKDMQPNYGWRHRFKTQTNELEITVRVADAIQGHPGKTAADDYGEINLKTRWNAIQKLPRIPLD